MRACGEKPSKASGLELLCRSVKMYGGDHRILRDFGKRKFSVRRGMPSRNYAKTIARSLARGCSHLFRAPAVKRAKAVKRILARLLADATGRLKGSHDRRIMYRACSLRDFSAIPIRVIGAEIYFNDSTTRRGTDVITCKFSFVYTSPSYCV